MNYKKEAKELANKVLEKLEEEGKIFVFRPSRKVKMSRIEKDEDKLQEMYELGIKDGNDKLNSLIEFLKK